MLCQKLPLTDDGLMFAGETLRRKSPRRLSKGHGGHPRYRGQGKLCHGGTLLPCIFILDLSVTI